MEALGDDIVGNFDRVGVFGCQGAVFEGGGEEVDDGEGKTLARVWLCLEGVLVWVEVEYAIGLTILSVAWKDVVM